MKKNLLLLFASVLALGASAQLLHTASQPKMAQAQKERFGDRMATHEAGMTAKQAKKMAAIFKAEGDVDYDTLYIRPKGTYYICTRVGETSGWRGLLLPAYTDITWRNFSNQGYIYRTNNGRTYPVNLDLLGDAVQYGWYTVNHEDGKYYLQSEDYDFVDNQEPSPLKNYFEVGGSTYWLGKDSSHAPFLVINDAEDGYQAPGLIQYGAAPRVMTDTTQALFTTYPVTSYSVFSGEWQVFNAGYFYFTSEDWTYGATNPNTQYWLDNLKKYDFVDQADDVTACEVTSIYQMLDQPNAPYLLNAVNWAFGYYSKENVNLTLNIRKVEDGVIGDVLATTTVVLPKKEQTSTSSFATYITFPLTTIAEDGGEEEGVVIKDQVVLELTGFAPAYADGVFTAFVPQVVGHYAPYAIAEDRFDSFTGLKVTVAGEEIDHITDNGFGYFLDDDNVLDSLFYIGSFRYSLNMEMPWLVADTNAIELPVDGGEVVLPISAYKSSDEWTITLEDGSPLPDWLIIDYMDEMYRDIEYALYTELTFSADALPQGTTGRQAKVLLSYRGAAEQVITITQGEVEDEPKVPGDVTGDGVVDIADVSAAINIMLGLKQASDYPGNADVNNSGNVDVADINALVNMMLN